MVIDNDALLMIDFSARRIYTPDLFTLHKSHTCIWYFDTYFCCAHQLWSFVFDLWIHTVVVITPTVIITSLSLSLLWVDIKSFIITFASDLKSRSIPRYVE